MRYDLSITNGTVIDPATGTMEKRNLFVKDGYIAAGAADAESARTINADGCYVVPGLIDGHTHMYDGGSAIAGKVDAICPPSGVTTVIDAGSAGIGTFSGFYRVHTSWATTVKAAVCASLNGVQNLPHEEVQDPVFVTPEAMLPLFKQYGDFLVGIKVRAHGRVTGQWGLAAIRQARETAGILRAEGFRCNRIVHLGQFAEDVTLPALLELLDPGDVLTHIFRPDNGGTILDAQGKVSACVREARARGVIFDTSCGRSHLSLASARKAFADGFHPQIISTDMVRYTAFNSPSGWLALKMSMYLNLGMPLLEVVKAVTTTPAAVYGIQDEAGSLDVGKPADIAVFRLEDRNLRLDDLYGESMQMEKVLVPMATLKRGLPLFQQIYFGA